MLSPFSGSLPCLPESTWRRVLSIRFRRLRALPEADLQWSPPTVNGEVGEVLRGAHGRASESGRRKTLQALKKPSPSIIITDATETTHRFKGLPRRERGASVRV